MIGTAPLSLDQATEQIEGVMQPHAAFAQVENAIDAARLSKHHKAALWLLAWSLRDPAIKRRDARLMAGLCSPPTPAAEHRQQRRRLGGSGPSPTQPNWTMPIELGTTLVSTGTMPVDIRGTVA